MTAGRTPLAERIILERVKRDWTQIELAKHAGISPSTVALAETGRSQVRPRTIFRIARALELDPTEMLRLAEEE